MANIGGKRVGAGRPKGSTTKPRVSDFLSTEKVEELVDKATTLASSGDTTMLKFVLEQCFGRAPQSVDLTSGYEPVPLLSALRDENKQAN